MKAQNLHLEMYTQPIAPHYRLFMLLFLIGPTPNVHSNSLNSTSFSIIQNPQLPAEITAH